MEDIYKNTRGNISFSGEILDSSPQGQKYDRFFLPVVFNTVLNISAWAELRQKIKQKSGRLWKKEVKDEFFFSDIMILYIENPKDIKST